MIRIKIGKYELEFDGALGICAFMVAAFCITAVRMSGV